MWVQCWSRLLRESKGVFERCMSFHEGCKGTNGGVSGQLWVNEMYNGFCEQCGTH